MKKTLRKILGFGAIGIMVIAMPFAIVGCDNNSSNKDCCECNTSINVNENINNNTNSNENDNTSGETNANLINICYHLNGGVNSNTNKNSIELGENQKISIDIPTREGYTFVDWYVNEECTQVFDGSICLEDKEICLYAQWTTDYSIEGTTLKTLYNKNIETFLVPSRVTEIGSGFFADCTKLTNIKSYHNLNIIGDFAFYNCDNLTSITLPYSVTTIKDYAFEDCTKLTSITIPRRVTSIGRGVLDDCVTLIDIIVENGNAIYDDFDCNAIIEKSTKTLIQGCSGTSLRYYTDITAIGDYAFYSCENLTNITIPDKVTTIGDYAFYDCYNLISIEIPDSVTTIGENAFKMYYHHNKTPLTRIYIDSETVANGLTELSSFGYILNNPDTIYIKSGLIVTDSTYLLNNFTRQETSNLSGYDKYVKNS